MAAQVVLGSALVLIIVVLLNYLSQAYYLRFYLSDRTRAELSTRTVFFLKTLTNNVTATIYYDRTDPMFSTVYDLLNEYQLINPRIRVQTVDYLRDPGGAQKIKTAYQLSSAEDKDLVVFDAGAGKHKVVDGKALAQYALEQVAADPGEEGPKYRRRPVAFLGEMAFTAALVDVTSPKQLTAYFLQGHYEHDIESGDQVSGYLNFASLLQKQNFIQVRPLTLVGTNRIPADCNLLVIAGPRSTIPEPELAQIEQYLAQGGRLLAMFNASTADRATGLEKILAKWGVAVGANEVVDPDRSSFGSEGSDVIIGFSPTNRHPVINPLIGRTGLYLVRPRTISKYSNAPEAADAPRVELLAYTSPNAYLRDEPSRRRQFPMMAAVEKGAVKGVVSERGVTRMLVVGDSFFLANHQLSLFGNRDFAGYAANWLLDRSQLLEGVGPRPVSEYRLVMTKSQTQRAQIVLLAGMPGCVLLLGGLVWLRRRR